MTAKEFIADIGMSLQLSMLAIATAAYGIIPQEAAEL